MLATIYLLVFWACQEAAPEAKQVSAEKSADTTEMSRERADQIRSVVKARVSMPDEMARQLTVDVMPNDVIAGVRDPNTRICFVVAQKQKGWAVVHMGTAMPVDWTVNIDGKGAMLILAEVDNIKRWFNAHCLRQ